jgi:uncharacterized membrane protein YdfJ with MMPL/SSD domain
MPPALPCLFGPMVDVTSRFYQLLWAHVTLTNGGTLFLLRPYLVEGEQIVRTFLITLTASTVASVILWQLGLAAKIWPAHPLLTTVILAALGAAVVQLFLTYDPTTRLK